MPTLTFLGATGTVTGSRYLLEDHDTRILIDAGLFQGPKELRKRNWEPFPVDAHTLDAIVLTHAHIDHTGYLPRLVAQGFDGPTYVTPPTQQLLRVLLPDAAHLQEEDARYANKVGSSRHKPALPLFTSRDAKEALGTLEPAGFKESHEIRPGLTFRYHRQGHILGAAAVEIAVKTAGGKHVTVYFSGDVGRYDVPILKPPEPYPGSTYLVVESTYGDRLHGAGNPREQLGETINATAARGGVVVIPAFAIDRTQEILYFLRELAAEGEIPPLPIYLDSPMAREATAAYRRTIREHDAEARAIAAEGTDPLTPPNLTVVGKVEESKRINDERRPAVIISASGMATGGRILHHLRHRLGDHRNTILFVGYQARGTRGRRLLEGEKKIKIFGQWITVNAEVRSISSLSAHADADELTIWASRAESTPEQVFVTHGEPDASRALADHFGERFSWPCTVPELGESFEL